MIEISIGGVDLISEAMAPRSGPTEMRGLTSRARMARSESPSAWMEPSARTGPASGGISVSWAKAASPDLSVVRFGVPYDARKRMEPYPPGACLPVAHTPKETPTCTSRR